MPSPLGDLVLTSNGEALVQINLPGSDHAPLDAAEGTDAVLNQARRELEEYFAGERRTFTVPLATDGTDFQQAAWEALRQIPYGEVRSYGDQAAMIGKPGAARAIGQANRRNALPIVVPCHRVITSTGGIGGYMGGDGRDTFKVDLLRLEGAWDG